MDYTLDEKVWIQTRTFRHFAGAQPPVSTVAVTGRAQLAIVPSRSAGRMTRNPRRFRPRPSHPAIVVHSLSNRNGGDGASSRSRSSLLWNSVSSCQQVPSVSARMRARPPAFNAPLAGVPAWRRCTRVGGAHERDLSPRQKLKLRLSR